MLAREREVPMGEAPMNSDSLSGGVLHDLVFAADAAQAHGAHEEEVREGPFRAFSYGNSHSRILDDLDRVDTQLDGAHYDVGAALWLEEEVVIVELGFLGEVARNHRGEGFPVSPRGLDGHAERRCGVGLA